MKKKEAKFGLLFRHWLKQQTNIPSALFELKQTGDKNYLPFEAVKEHQVNALLAGKTKQGLLYKAPDDSMGWKAVDYFFMSECAAFVVIKYPQGFEGISIENFIAERTNSPRKSLTYERAHQISSFSG